MIKGNTDIKFNGGSEACFRFTIGSTYGYVFTDCDPLPAVPSDHMGTGSVWRIEDSPAWWPHGCFASGEGTVQLDTVIPTGIAREYNIVMPYGTDFNLPSVEVWYADDVFDGFGFAITDREFAAHVLFENGEEQIEIEGSVLTIPAPEAGEHSMSVTLSVTAGGEFNAAKIVCPETGRILGEASFSSDTLAPDGLVPTTQVVHLGYNATDPTPMGFLSGRVSGLSGCDAEPMRVANIEISNTSTGASVPLKTVAAALEYQGVTSDVGARYPGEVTVFTIGGSDQLYTPPTTYTLRFL